MIDININRKTMEANVYVHCVHAKREELDKDSLKTYMIELAGDDVDTLRKATRLFKPTYYEFKDIK